MIEIIPNWHPLFVHFPIAFSAAAVFFMAMGKVFRGQAWATQSLLFGRWMLWAAAIFACVAAVFGWFAYNSVDHDDAGHLAMTLHRNWALVALAALALLATIDIWPKKSAALPSNIFLAALIAAWLLVVNAAWHGGEVVFRHGLGVMSLPKPESHGDGHEHGGGHEHGAGQGDAPQPGEATSGGHAHEDESHAQHPHAVVPSDKKPAVNGAGSPAKKAGHSHAPGTAPHQD